MHKPHPLVTFQAVRYAPVVAKLHAAVHNRPLVALQAAGYAPVVAEPHVVAHTPVFWVAAVASGPVVAYAPGDSALAHHEGVVAHAPVHALAGGDYAPGCEVPVCWRG